MQTYTRLLAVCAAAAPKSTHSSCKQKRFNGWLHSAVVIKLEGLTHCPGRCNDGKEGMWLLHMCSAVMH
jgi:hypothetical protein